MLLELELPRLLAPDLPSSRYSQRPLPSAHCNRRHAVPAPLCLVTASPPGNWASFAPAATHGSGGRLSGPLSGIKPRFPVTRRRQGRPRPYLPADRAKFHPARPEGSRRRPARHRQHAPHHVLAADSRGYPSFPAGQIKIALLSRTRSAFRRTLTCMA